MSTPVRRTTRQRSAVARLLEGQETFLSAQDIYAELRSSGESIGLATVYRTLQGMVEAGEIDTLRTPEGEQSFRRCGPSHHHHLVCRVCGRTVEVDDPPVARWVEKVGDQHGFTDVQHDLEIFGTCDRCHEGRRRGARATQPRR